MGYYCIEFRIHYDNVHDDAFEEKKTMTLQILTFLLYILSIISIVLIITLSFVNSTVSGIYSILLEIGLCLHLFDQLIGLACIEGALLLVLLHYCDRYKKIVANIQKSNSCKTESEKDKTVEIKSKEK